MQIFIAPVYKKKLREVRNVRDMQHLAELKNIHTKQVRHELTCQIQKHGELVLDSVGDTVFV